MRARRSRTIKSKTKQFIEELTEHVSKILPCYYQESPSDGSFPFAVVNGCYITSLESGDLCNFYIDVWADEKNPLATEEIEETCDTLRNALNNLTLAKAGIFSSHLGFESQADTAEAEFDLAHRRLSFTARIFYIGG